MATIETFTNFRRTTDAPDRGGFGAGEIFAFNVLNATDTINPASLVDGAGATQAVTVTGAALGDFVMVSAPYDLQDITVTGYVSAADTVEIRIQNESGSTVDLGSGDWKVKVIQDNL